MGQSDRGVLGSACMKEKKEQQLESASKAGRSAEFMKQPIAGVTRRRKKGTKKKEKNRFHFEIELRYYVL